MEDILTLIDGFQAAVCLWEDEVLIGFDPAAQAEREREVTEIKEALITAILENSG
jgi:hypothetical protein